MEQSDNNTALPAGEQDELSRLRRSIDAVDEKIAEMLVQRARLAKAVGAAKGGVNVYRPEREQAVIAHALERSSQAGSPFSAESVRRIYTEIISACRALESRPSVAFLDRRSISRGGVAYGAVRRRAGRKQHAGYGNADDGFVVVDCAGRDRRGEHCGAAQSHESLGAHRGC